MKDGHDYDHIMFRILFDIGGYFDFWLNHFLYCIIMTRNMAYCKNPFLKEFIIFILSLAKIYIIFVGIYVVLLWIKNTIINKLLNHY